MIVLQSYDPNAMLGWVFTFVMRCCFESGSKVNCVVLLLLRLTAQILTLGGIGI